MKRLTAEVKTGRTDGAVSSLNLFFSSGLRLRTDDLKWLCVEDKDRIRAQFNELVEALREMGLEIKE